MIDRKLSQINREKANKLGRAAITLVIIIAAQVIALEFVLRGWQAKEAFVVFSGIVSSAILCALSVIIFIRTRYFPK